MKERMRVALLLSAAALVHGNTLHNGFAQDDEIYILQNHALTGHALRELFAPNYFSHVFRPDPALFRPGPACKRICGSLSSNLGFRRFFQIIARISLHPTISHSSLVWTEKEIRWNGSGLQVAAPSTTERDNRETVAGSRLDNQSAERSCQTGAV